MTIQQSHFRIRNIGGLQTINQDSDWAASLDVDATLDAVAKDGGCLFGLRVELEEIVAASTTVIPKLQYRRNAGTWTDCEDVGSIDSYELPQNNTGVWGVIVVNKGTISDGAVTTNILAGSSKTFVAGTGEWDATGASTTLNDEHTEIEWRVLIRTLHSSPSAKTQFVDGDEFEFRVVESDNTLLGGTYVIPTITLNIPTGYIGGTCVETSGNKWFVQTSAGTLYMPVEAAEVGPDIMMMKSTDGGDSWAAVDSGTTVGNDMESAALVYDDVNKIVHMIHVAGEVEYYQFATEDYATVPSQDTWLTGRFSQLNASMDATNQSCDLVLRGSTLYALYPDLNTTEQIYYNKKADLTTGAWSGETSVDTTGGTTDFSGVAAVLGPNSDDIHIFYSDLSNFNIHHRTLDTSDVLGTLHTCETDLSSGNDAEHGMTNAMCWYNGSIEKAMIGYIDNTNGYLYTVIVENDGTPNARQVASNSVAVLTNPVALNSRQPAASIAHDVTDDKTYVLYVDDSTEDLWLATNTDGAGWTGHTEQQDAVMVHQIRAQVFTHASGIHGGDRVLGWISENAVDQDGASPRSGYTGGTRYDEFQIAAGGTDTSDSQSTYMAGSLGADDNQLAYAEGATIFPFTEDFSVGGDGDEWARSHWLTI